MSCRHKNPPRGRSSLALQRPGAGATGAPRAGGSGRRHRRRRAAGRPAAAALRRPRRQRDTQLLEGAQHVAHHVVFHQGRGTLLHGLAAQRARRVDDALGREVAPDAKPVLGIWRVSGESPKHLGLETLPRAAKRARSGAPTLLRGSALKSRWGSIAIGSPKHSECEPCLVPPSSAFFLLSPMLNSHFFSLAYAGASVLAIADATAPVYPLPIRAPSCSSQTT